LRSKGNAYLFFIYLFIYLYIFFEQKDEVNVKGASFEKLHRWTDLI